ncbi:sigma-70 family RNA polymerase sigma factor [Spongisporangium articulatum]|uniref:Sigma-70 family RNA polymerase sigma factor n=1 Tax=Spongisporangium articulatum TaxID=3362603 RepID=A0ABW8AHL8_9ACTN
MLDSRDAIATLITEHLPLVGHVARETAARLPRHLGTDDLIGAGSLALVQAAHAFDPALGVPFARFANTRVRGAMIDQMRQRDWASRTVRSRAKAIEAAAETLTSGLGRRPTDSELAAACGFTEAEIREARSGADRAVLLSLDPLTADDEGLGTSVADSAPRPEEALIAAERLGYLRDAVAELPERLRLVVTQYYLEQRPLTEIAETLGVTQSRASQLRSEGLDLLREALERLWVSTPGVPRQRAGGTTPGADGAGARARRREAYVQAVATRSSAGRRADVQAYLDGQPLHYTSY